jgi:hypothetical protein
LCLYVESLTWSSSKIASFLLWSRRVKMCFYKFDKSSQNVVSPIAVRACSALLCHLVERFFLLDSFHISLWPLCYWVPLHCFQNSLKTIMHYLSHHHHHHWLDSRTWALAFLRSFCQLKYPAIASSDFVTRFSRPTPAILEGRCFLSGLSPLAN